MDPHTASGVDLGLQTAHIVVQQGLLDAAPVIAMDKVPRKTPPGSQCLFGRGIAKQQRSRVVIDRSQHRGVAQGFKGAPCRGLHAIHGRPLHQHHQPV